MKTFAKILGSIFLILLIVFVGAPLIALQLIDPADLKAQIEQRALTATGRTLHIGGDLEITAYPWLGATMADVTIGNASGFSDTAFAHVIKANVRVKLLPLLTKQVEMDTVVMTGFELNLERKADGTTNIDDLKALVTSEGAEGGEVALGALALGGLELSNGTVRWIDGQLQQDVTVSSLGLRTGAIDLTNPTIPVSTRFLINSQTPGLTAALALSTTFTQGASDTQWLATGTRIELDATGAVLQNAQVKSTLNADIAYDQASGDMVLNNLALDAPAFAYAGNTGALRAVLTRLAYLPSAGSVAFSGLSLDAPNLTTANGTGGLKVVADGAEYQLDGSALAADAVSVTATNATIGKFSGSFVAKIDAIAMDPNIGQATSKGLDLKVSPFSFDGISGSAALAGDAQIDPTKQHVRIANMQAAGDISGGAIGTGRLPFTVKGNAALDWTNGVGAIADMALNATNFNIDDTKGTLTATGDLALQLAGPRITFKTLELKGNIAGRAVRGGQATVALTSAVDADLGRESYNLSGLNLTLSNLTTMGVAGTIKLRGHGTGNARKSTWSAKGLTITTDLTGEALPEGKLKSTLTANAVLNTAKQSLTVSSFNAKTSGLAAKGNITIAGLGSAPSYRGDLAVAPFAPRKILRQFAQPVPKLRDPKTLHRVSMGTTFSGTLNRIRLKPLLLKVDDTTLRGTASITNFSNPKYRFDLKVNGINADRYMPTKAKSQAASPGAAAAAATGLPKHTLRDLNAKGKFTIGKLTIADMRLSNVSLNLDANGGLVKLSPLSARLYRGAYAGNIIVDARNKTPQLRVNERLKDIDIGRFLQDLNGQTPLTGTGSLSAKLNARGDNSKAIIASLNGNIDFNLVNGVARGAFWDKTRQNIRSNLNSLQVAGVQCDFSGILRDQETPFNQLVGAATVSKGIINIPKAQNIKIRAKHQRLDVDAYGTVNLPREQFDIRTDLKIYEKCHVLGQGVRIDLSKVKFPIRISGPFANPKAALDQRAIGRAVEKLIANVAGKFIEREAEKLLDKGAKKLLKGLFN